MVYNIELKTEMIKQGMKQKSLADQIGKTETFISQIINGRLNPNEEEKTAIADALGVKVSEIFVDGQK